MNLNKYYEEVKMIRRGLSEPFVYLTSLATANGGKQGMVAEVATDLAARMIADGTARESSPEEILAYQQENEALRAAAQEEDLRSRLRITLVNDPEFQLLSEKRSLKPKVRG